MAIAGVIDTAASPSAIIVRDLADEDATHTFSLLAELQPLSLESAALLTQEIYVDPQYAALATERCRVLASDDGTLAGAVIDALEWLEQASNGAQSKSGFTGLQAQDLLRLLAQPGAPGSRLSHLAFAAYASSRNEADKYRKDLATIQRKKVDERESRNAQYAVYLLAKFLGATDRKALEAKLNEALAMTKQATMASPTYEVPNDAALRGWLKAGRSIFE